MAKRNVEHQISRSPKTKPPREKKIKKPFELSYAPQRPYVPGMCPNYRRYLRDVEKRDGYASSLFQMSQENWGKSREGVREEGEEVVQEAG